MTTSSSSSSSSNAIETARKILERHVPLFGGNGSDDDVKEYVVQVLAEEASSSAAAAAAVACDDDGENDIGARRRNDLVELLEPLLAELTAAASNDDDDDGSRNLAHKVVDALFEEVLKEKTQQKQHQLPPQSEEEELSPIAEAAAEDDDDEDDTTASNSSDSDSSRGNPRSNPTATATTTVKKEKEKKKKTLKERREERRKRNTKKSGQDGETDGQQQQQPPAEDSLDVNDDYASTWQECCQQGAKWGGRGRGGRGEYAGAVNSVRSNIHLSNVTLSLPGNRGLELLQNSTVDVARGHRYGLCGRNGVGKSTLLRLLASKSVPGMPLDMRVLLVRQQIEGTDLSSLDTLVRADLDRTALLREQEEAERKLETLQLSDEDLKKVVDRLGNIVAELDAIGADTAEDRAMEILNGLQFTDAMIRGPTRNLSGGWRMRLALAQSLFVQSDLLLFDECTNHLDLHGLDWLINYLNKDPDRTLIVVSHDRHFLNAVCTDIVVLENQKLKYHVGNYADYERQQQEKAAREGQILDAAERQRTKAEAFIQKQQAASNKKSADPKKQRQAKMMREKKLERIGNYREDGKRYKQNSLKQLSEKHIRLAQKVVIEADEPIVKMYFPPPVWPPGIALGDAIVRLEDFSFGFDSSYPLLRDITLSVNRGSKIALVGRNGAGKSTLLKLISGEIEATKHSSRGNLWAHSNIRIGHVTQYAVEELENYAEQLVTEYAEEKLRRGKASAEIVAKASGNIRQYLGAFGLGGRHALQKIGSLSGGERMRLCFATVLAEQPHLLILDESTNHVDIETLDSTSDALNAFQGSVLMVSHNQSFLSGFCNELWVLENGSVTVNHSDTETFDELFSDYRSAALDSSTKSLKTRRQEKADMAKRATKQRAGARQNTALL